LTEAERPNPVLSAIREQEGLAGKLAAVTGLTRQAVWMWKRVPPRHAVAVAKYLNLPEYIVCPEVFPTPEGALDQKNSTRD
jgi:hypothetical protein